MNKFLANKGDLEKYKSNEDIVRKTGLQVRKDFAQFGFEIEIPDNLHFAYNNLFDQLAPLIEKLLDKSISKLYSMLYCIDLNETKIQEGISEMSYLKVHDAITHLILERELKKVITREYFSKNI